MNKKGKEANSELNLKHLELLKSDFIITIVLAVNFSLNLVFCTMDILIF